MSKASEALQRRFGQNLSESLGVRMPGASPPRSGAIVPGDGPKATSPDDGRTRARDAGHMELTRIVPDPDQPRKEFSADAIDRLSASLIKHGQLMPIRVRWNTNIGKWVVISGERRYRAAIRAGLKSVACIFAEDGLSQSEILQEQIIENLLREDLKPIEQARAYRQLMDLHSWTAKELSLELHVSQGAISKSLSLLTLPEDLQKEVDDGSIPATAAYEVAKVADPDRQRDVVRRIAEENLTRDDVAKVVREVSEKPQQVRATRPERPRPGMSTIEMSREKVVVSSKEAGHLDDEAVLRILRLAVEAVLVRSPHLV